MKEEEEEEEKEQAEKDDGCCRAQTLGKLCNFPFALQLCRGNSKGKVSERWQWPAGSSFIMSRIPCRAYLSRRGYVKLTQAARVSQEAGFMQPLREKFALA